MTQTRGAARIGLLVPYTNSNLEPDFAMICPAGVSIHVARMAGYDEAEIPDAAQMKALGETDLDAPLAMLAGVHPDVVVYGCTSATLTHGPSFDQRLAQDIATRTGAQTVTAAGALVFALRHIEASSIGFASPYVADINDLAIDFLSHEGIETVARADVGKALSNEGQGALGAADIFDLALRADAPEAQAIVLSCTDMRSLETLQSIEDHLGKPVICSNQAMMFQVLHHLKLPDRLSGFGTLLQKGPVL